jgi:hypothetical protein
VDVPKRKVRLDPVFHTELCLFDIEVGRSIGHHIGNPMHGICIAQVRSAEGIIQRVQRGQIVETATTQNGDLIGLRIDLRQLVALFVGPEFPNLTRLGRERYGASHLQDHLGHGFAKAPDLLAVLLEVLRDVSGFGVAHVDVQ